CIASASSVVFAETTETEEAVKPKATLQTIVVTATEEEQKQVGQTVKTAEQLAREMASNSHDLVRYNTEVDVAEVGRYGNKGFAIRGVDGNRVAMNIDGVALPEAEANEIFSPYGYMYEGRFNPDLEMMRSVNITAGADSLASGSGAVGGAVSYQTKQPSDFVQDGNLGGYAKLGYASKNEESLTAAGLAGTWNKAEFLINYAQRHGKETQNHANRQSDNARLDPSYIFSAEEMPVASSSNSLIYPNPLDFKRESALAKFYYHLNDSHRIGVHGFYQEQNNHINTDSANTTTGSRTGSTTRRAHDKEQMQSYGVNYRYQPADAKIVQQIDVDYTHSDVLGLADTWIYDRTYKCSDSSVSRYMCEYRGHQLVLDTATLSHQEYRPAQTVSDQVHVKFKSQPFNWGMWGEHQFGLNSNYVRQDYTTSATYLSATSIASHISAAFPDAKKTNYNFTLTDSIYFNDRLKAMLGVRYDHYRYKPYFETDVNGFNEQAYSVTPCNNASNNTLFCENYRAGKGLPETSFKHFTYSGAFDWSIIPEQLTARYKIGTGFLAPTVTQIYSQFEGLGARQVPNYDLKPEKSLNQELELSYKPTPNVNLSVAGYISKYDDFIHTRFWQGNTNNCTDRLTCMQSVNLDEAEVKGLKLGIDADLSDVLGLAGQFKVSAQMHTANDSAWIMTDSNGKQKINTLAAVPRNFLFGADYLSADQSWEVHAKLRVLNRKQADDTKTLETRAIRSLTTTACPSDYAAYGYCAWMGYDTYDQATGTWVKTAEAITGYEDYVDTYQHIDQSKTATLIDLYGSKKIGKKQNLILSAGIYNLTNVKYIPWETLRQFNNSNANTMIDSNGYGFARYTAPGRNYSVALEYKF
ncbi:MAG: TonB-dependent hemoglobin/transferrin/lactoferrin family receptor, partial [Acinetobacter sp.]|nr:TonB-dependent hemoglobin/transferrin/lactoferrin family receptor [Acinetobacter sp.]